MRAININANERILPVPLDIVRRRRKINFGLGFLAVAGILLNARLDFEDRRLGIGIRPYITVENLSDSSQVYALRTPANYR